MTHHSTPQYVPGTGRRIMSTRGGKQMERAFVWLEHSTWNKLREIGMRQGVSDSIIIERLVNLASAA